MNCSPLPWISKTALPATPGAILSVVCIGSLWGLYWIPLRALQALLQGGPWITFSVVSLACLGLAPFAWKGRKRVAISSNRALMSIALGGASFVLYSDGLLYGQVAVVILFFYLTPVWSTLIVRVWLQWPVSPWRYAAIVTGLLGIALVLQASHPQGLPLPKSLGDLFGLASGLLWSIASTGMYVHSRTRPAETNFIFCFGGMIMAAVLALMLAPLPQEISCAKIPAVAGWAILLGLGWWALSLTAFMWATRNLEPPRIGILLMSEVIVGAASAALLSNEPFTPVMGAGAVLVIVAGCLESLSGLKRKPTANSKGAPHGEASQGSTRPFF
jgi:drug/metabolite transporter (DMT)-like permease